MLKQKGENFLDCFPDHMMVVSEWKILIFKNISFSKDYEIFFYIVLKVAFKELHFYTYTIPTLINSTKFISPHNTFTADK